MGTTENAFASLPAPASGTQLNMAKQNPHGGTLVDLMLKTDAEKEVAVAATLPLLSSPINLCSIRLTSARSVTEHQRLSILVRSWLPQNAESTTWVERSPV